MPGFSKCATVVYPESADLDAIKKLLHDHGIKAPLLLTYSDWIKTGQMPQDELLCIRESGVWVIGETPSEKIAIEQEVRSAIENRNTL